RAPRLRVRRLRVRRLRRAPRLRVRRLGVRRLRRAPRLRVRCLGIRRLRGAPRRAARARLGRLVGRLVLRLLLDLLGPLVDRRLDAPPVRAVGIAALLEADDLLLRLVLDRGELRLGLVPQHDRAPVGLDGLVARPRAIAVDQHHGEQEAVDQGSSHGVTSSVDVVFFRPPPRRPRVPNSPSPSTSSGTPTIVIVNHTASWLLVCSTFLSSSDTMSPENTSSPPSQRIESPNNGPDTMIGWILPSAFWMLMSANRSTSENTRARKPSLPLIFGPSTAAASGQRWRFSRAASNRKFCGCSRSSHDDSIEWIVIVFFGASPFDVNGISSSAPESIMTRPLPPERDSEVVDACAENCVVITNLRSEAVIRCGRYSRSSTRWPGAIRRPSRPSSAPIEGTAIGSSMTIRRPPRSRYRSSDSHSPGCSGRVGAPMMTTVASSGISLARSMRPSSLVS